MNIKLTKYNKDTIEYYNVTKFESKNLNPYDDFIVTLFQNELKTTIFNIIKIERI